MANNNVMTIGQLIEALIQQESSGNPRAVSPTGYVGLMQLSPSDTMESMRTGVPSVFDVAEGAGFDVGSRTRSDAERLLMDPEVNVGVGVPYLVSLMQKYNWNYPAALTAYNAGPGRYDDVMSAGGTLADMPEAEQRTYAADVAEEFRNLFGYDMPMQGVLVSPTPPRRPRGLLSMQ